MTRHDHSSALRLEILTLINLTTARSGLTQAEIARRLKVSRGRISDWKSGRRVPSTACVVSLAILAGADPARWVLRVQRAGLPQGLRGHVRVP